VCRANFQPNALKCFLVGQAFYSPHILLKELVQVNACDLGGDSLDVLNIVRFSMQIVRIVGALDIKLVIHLPHNVIQRLAAARLLSYQ